MVVVSIQQLNMAPSLYRCAPVLYRSFSTSSCLSDTNRSGREGWVELPPAHYPPSSRKEQNITKYFTNPNRPKRTEAERIEYTDRTARFPPAVAEKRYERLRENKRLGIGPHTIKKKRKSGGDADIPVNIPLDKKDRDRIPFEVQAGMSNDRRAFFESDVEVEMGEKLDWGEVEMAESVSGLEVGRLIEVRR